MTLELFFILIVIWVIFYTLGNELMRYILGIIFGVAFWGTMIYIAVHFIHKYW